MSLKLRHGSYYYGLPVYQAQTIFNTTETFQTRYYCVNRETQNKFASGHPDLTDNRTCRDCNNITKYMLQAIETSDDTYIICTNCAPIDSFEKTHDSYQSH